VSKLLRFLSSTLLFLYGIALKLPILLYITCLLAHKVCSTRNALTLNLLQMYLSGTW